MIRILLAGLMVATPAIATGASRDLAFGSFDRLRVSGPFEVRVTTGASPRGHVEGDPRALERLEVDVEGGTLTLRMGNGGWGERAATADGQRALAPPVITLSTPALVAASVQGGGQVTVGRMAGDRIDLAVNGGGALSVADAATQQLTATLIGNGRMTLAGKAQRARLTATGAGTIDAAALAADDLLVLHDGTGEVGAAARYTAQVTSSGLGRVSVAGRPKCTIRGAMIGPISCGAR